MKQSRKGMLMAALICGTIAPVLWGGASVYATEAEAIDEALSAFELNPMVITAQRTETKELDTPASVSVVTKKDIEKTGATTALEALRRVPGITDYSYGPYGDDVGSSYSRIYLRGFDKGALVLVNGAPININNYASPNAIPIESIEKIEVVKGSNSVLYGAEALGGVVNIITKKGEGKVKYTVSGTVGNYVEPTVELAPEVVVSKLESEIDQLDQSMADLETDYDKAYVKLNDRRKELLKKRDEATIKSKGIDAKYLGKKVVYRDDKIFIIGTVSNIKPTTLGTYGIDVTFKRFVQLHVEPQKARDNTPAHDFYEIERHTAKDFLTDTFTTSIHFKYVDDMLSLFDDYLNYETAPYKPLYRVIKDINENIELMLSVFNTKKI